MKVMYPQNGTYQAEVPMVVSIQIRQVHVVTIVMFSTLLAFSMITTCVFFFRHRRVTKERAQRRN